MSASKWLSLPTASSVGCRNGIRVKDRALVDVVGQNHQPGSIQLTAMTNTPSRRFCRISLVGRRRLFSLANLLPLSVGWFHLQTHCFNGTNGVHVVGTCCRKRYLLYGQSTEDISIGVLRRLAVLDGVVELSKK